MSDSGAQPIKAVLCFLHKRKKTPDSPFADETRL